MTEAQKFYDRVIDHEAALAAFRREHPGVLPQPYQLDTPDGLRDAARRLDTKETR